MNIERVIDRVAIAIYAPDSPNWIRDKMDRLESARSVFDELGMLIRDGEFVRSQHELRKLLRVLNDYNDEVEDISWIAKNANALIRDVSDMSRAKSSVDSRMKLLRNHIDGLGD